MRRIILAALPALFLGSAVTAYAVSDTTKGAAAGAAVGHETGSGHAVAGAATGAAIGHHEQKKAEQSKSK